jgi:hypothetical protein
VNAAISKRLIAAVLMLNLVSWANSAAYCLSGLGNMARHAAMVASVSSHSQHSCCPQRKTQSDRQTVSAAEICHHGHECCFVQNPQIPSNLPEGPREIGQATPAVGEIFITAIPAESTAAESFETFQPYSSFSSILRV